MNNIRGTHIQGQIAKPAKEGKFPAMLIVQWAGVYPLHKDWVTGRAAEGWLALNIEARPARGRARSLLQAAVGRPAEELYRIGNEDRETSYFLRMYLSCYRAAEYLTTREDWDGKVFVVTGGSQGGLQTIVTAAIHPKVTAAIACVPAGATTRPGCRPLAGLAAVDGVEPQGEGSAKIHEASRYYDVVNFALG